VRLIVMRNEDYDRELLAIVTSCCVLIAAAVTVLDISPSATKGAATASTSAEQSAVATVRVVGTPFVPNTNPSQR
jgi:hypothetical protein